MSVKRDWVPGCGRSLRMTSRMPLDQVLFSGSEHQHAVEVHDDTAVGGRAARPGRSPDPLAYFGTCATDCRKGVQIINMLS
jgi:hypothetical protein